MRTRQSIRWWDWPCHTYDSLDAEHISEPYARMDMRLMPNPKLPPRIPRETEASVPWWLLGMGLAVWGLAGYGLVRLIGG